MENLVLDNLLQKSENSDNIKAFSDDVSLLGIGKTQYGIIKQHKNIIKKIIKFGQQNDLQISTLKTKVVYRSKMTWRSHAFETWN